MILDKKYQVAVIRTTKFKALGINCKKGDIIKVSADILIANGSTHKVECQCDKCGVLFERQARQIKERDAGDKWCTRCSWLETSTGRIKSEDTRLKLSLVHKGNSKSVTHKRNMSIAAKSEKRRKSNISNLKLAAKRNQEIHDKKIENKSGYDLYTHQCNKVRKATIKQNNITFGPGEGIYFKISLKTAYKIGMSPEIIGSKLTVLSNSDAGVLRMLDLNYRPKIKKPSKAFGFIEEFKRYHAAVYRKTKKIYTEFKNTINPKDLPRGKQLIGRDVYHIDHIVPITVCWENKVTVDECASAENLRMLHWKDNISKNNRLQDEHKYLLEQLILRSNKNEHTFL